MIDLYQYIRDIPDWPKPGILFKDITPLLLEPKAFDHATELMSHPFRSEGVQYVAGAESRGFIFGAAIAHKLQAGFIPIRKPEKLPHETISASYELEYGTDTLEIHGDAIRPGDKVLLVDDLIATGGTMTACCDLIKQLDGDLVGVSTLIHLSFLDGLEKLALYSSNIFSALRYE